MKSKLNRKLMLLRFLLYSSLVCIFVLGVFHFSWAQSEVSRMQLNTGVWFSVADTSDLFAFSQNITTRGFDPSTSAWLWYDLDFGSLGSRVSSFEIAPVDMNVTVSALNYADKEFSAVVVGASASSLLHVEMSGFSFPYVSNVSGAITSVDVSSFSGNELSFSVAGSGVVSVKVLYSGSLTPYWVKINGMVRLEGNGWSKSGGVVSVADVLSSSHSYVVGFHSLTQGTSTSGTEEKETETTEAVKVVTETIYRLTSNWLSVLLLLALLVSSVVAYVYDYGAWKFLAVGFVVLLINFFVAYLIVPMGLLPSDLAFVEKLTFKPPSLELASFPLQTQLVLQVAVMGFMLFSIMGSVFALVFKESD